MKNSGGALLAPVIAGLLLLLLVPVLLVFAMSFSHYDALGAPRIAGLDNFRQMLADDTLQLAATNSALIGLMAVPLRIGLALALALLLHRPGAARLPALLMVFAPVLVPGIVWTMLWLWILNPHFGPVAQALESWRPFASGWLLTVWGARLSIVGVLALVVGEMVLVMVAVRRLIPTELYEVCAVEGASGWTSFWRITFPWLLPVIALLAARDVAVSFELAALPSAIVTKGGPLFQTYLLPNYLYESGFEHLRFGYAAAIISSALLLSVSLMAMQYLALERWLGMER